MKDTTLPDWADERLAAIWLDWWLNEGPIEPGPDEVGAMEDFQTLMRRLSAEGYAVVKNGSGHV